MPIPALNNKTVTVTATSSQGGSSTGEAPQSNNFKGYAGGSGSMSASGSITQNRCNLCSAATPVPVLLQLISHDSGIADPVGGPAGCTGCDALNSDFFLEHSNDAATTCCWFSDPIEYCGTDPGYWMLEKKTATLWELTLFLSPPGDAPFAIVQYSLATANDECIFPIELGNPVLLTDPSCDGWPATITIAPAM